MKGKWYQPLLNRELYYREIYLVSILSIGGMRNIRLISSASAGSVSWATFHLPRASYRFILSKSFRLTKTGSELTLIVVPGIFCHSKSLSLAMTGKSYQQGSRILVLNFQSNFDFHAS